MCGVRLKVDFRDKNCSIQMKNYIGWSFWNKYQQKGRLVKLDMIGEFNYLKEWVLENELDERKILQKLNRDFK